MKHSEIKKIGKAAVLGKRKSTTLIGIFTFSFCVVMTLIVYGTIRLSQIASSFVTSNTAKLAIFAATALLLIVLSVLTLCAYSSSSVGGKAWYGGLTTAKENYTRRFFFWFRPKYSLRALKFKIMLNALKFSELFLLLLPSLTVFSTIFYLAQTGGIELYLFYALLAGGVLLALCALSFFFVGAQRYFLAEYIFSSKPKITAQDAIRQSKNLLDGHILEIVRFKMSFFPWFFGCLLIFPSIYFVPYYKASCSLVAKRIVL